MYRKEFLLRAGAIVLSASLAMSSPIAVLAEGNATLDQVESSVVEEVTDSDGVDIVPEGDISPPEDEKQPDNSEEEVTSPEVDDSADEADPTEKQPDTSTDADNPRDDADNSSVSTPSDAEEVEDEELADDTEVKQFTIKVVDHFGDTAKERESATLDKGTEYSYSALEDESWMVVGNSAYTGVLSKDLTIDFYYDSIEKSMPSLMSIEPTVSVTFNFGGTSVAVDASKITMQEFPSSFDTYYKVSFAKELIDGISLKDADEFSGKYDYDGKKWTFDKATITKNGIEVSDPYGDILLYETILYEGETFDLVFDFTEVQSSVTKPVSIDKDFGFIADKFYGTFKNLQLYVGNTKYELSYDAPVDIKFDTEDDVRLLTGDTIELWSGTCTVDNGSVKFNRIASSGYYNIVDTGDVVIRNTGKSRFGGGASSGTRMFYARYDLTTRDNSNNPIAGVSISDEAVEALSPVVSGNQFHLYGDIHEAGLPQATQYLPLTERGYQLGDNVYYTYRQDVDDFIGTINCLTDANGFTDMSFELPDTAVYESENRIAPGLSTGFISYYDSMDDWYEDVVWNNDGLLNFVSDIPTVANKGLTSLQDSNTNHGVLGSGYKLGRYEQNPAWSSKGKVLTLRDNFDNVIGTVTLEMTSATGNKPLSSDVELDGEKFNCVFDGFEGSYSIITPKVTINMANGVKDWTVSANYEASTATFHIVATKAGKADVSIYDVYGATYENGVVDTSEAVTIPRYEKSYAEPNKTVSVDSKGVTEYDSKEYKPLASKDADSNVSTANKLSIDVETGKSYEAFFYYGEGAEVPTPPEPPTPPIDPEKPPVVPPTEPEKPPVPPTPPTEPEKPPVPPTEPEKPPVVPPTPPTEPSKPTPTPKPDPKPTPTPKPDRPEVEKKVVIKVYDVYGDEPANLRQTDKVKEGSSYYYSKLEKGDYKVTGESYFEGRAYSNIDLYFYYKLPDLPVPVKPEKPVVPVVPEKPVVPVIPTEPEKPVIPTEPEKPVIPTMPKTGQADSLWGMLSLTSMLALIGTLFSKKRK